MPLAPVFLSFFLVSAMSRAMEALENARKSSALPVEIDPVAIERSPA